MKDERRGFSGFDDMVSDLSDLPAAPPPPQPPSLPKNTHLNDDPDDDTPTPGLKKPSDPKTGSSGWIYYLVVVLILGVPGYLIWQADQARTSTYSPPPSAAKSSPPSWAQAPQVSPSNPPQASPKPPPAQPFEQAPEPGQAIVINSAQLRYCLSQSIRIDGAEKAVNKTSQSAIDSFNGLVTDYNSRCGSIRYRKGDFESINPDVVSRRDALEKEGAALFNKPSRPSTGR